MRRGRLFLRGRRLGFRLGFRFFGLCIAALGGLFGFLLVPRVMFLGAASLHMLLVMGGHMMVADMRLGFAGGTSSGINRLGCFVRSVSCLLGSRGGFVCCLLSHRSSVFS